MQISASLTRPKFPKACCVCTGSANENTNPDFRVTMQRARQRAERAQRGALLAWKDSSEEAECGYWFGAGAEEDIVLSTRGGGGGWRKMSATSEEEEKRTGGRGRGAWEGKTSTNARGRRSTLSVRRMRIGVQRSIPACAARVPHSDGNGVQVIHENLEIKSGMITTIHNVTGTQTLVDSTVRSPPAPPSVSLPLHRCVPLPSLSPSRSISLLSLLSLHLLFSLSLSLFLFVCVSLYPSVSYPLVSFFLSHSLYLHFLLMLGDSDVCPLSRGYMEEVL
eukprot:1492549-Rhodomonas_salina.1